MSALLCALLFAAPLAPDAIEVSAGPQLAERSVRFSDAKTANLQNYASGKVWLWTAALVAYPAANHGLPLVGDLGLLASMSRSVSAPQLDATGGAAFAARFILWEIGARARVVIDGREWGGLSLRYTSARHDFSGSGNTDQLLPSGTFQSWEPGLDAKIPLGPLSLTLGAAYLFPAVGDAIGDAFPRATSGGVDARAALVLEVGHHLELRLEGRYSRIIYSLNPLPHDPHVAGGALDASTTVDLALGFHA